jgi:hypothetical protein
MEYAISLVKVQTLCTKEDVMFDIPAISLETMMKLTILMGGMLFFLCSFIFATDVLSTLIRKIWKKDSV